MQTFIYDVEGVRDHPFLETITLVERSGVTILTNTGEFPSQQARDGHLQSGMEWGAAESMDRLKQLVASMQATP